MLLLSRFDRLAYHGQHLSFLINATVMQEAARIVSRAKRPQISRDAPSVVRRMHDKNYKDIPDVDRDRFPPYYRRTFHWQTDGYFSDHSAEIYELGVELLFRGTADVMRRMIIPPITRFAADRSGLRVLDVACGTGRTLHQIARAHPKLRLHGADLSPAYIR